jgi:hypothetical protein
MDPTDAERELMAMQQEAFRLAHREHDLDGALTLIEQFLSTPRSDDDRAEVLAFRAILFEMHERFAEARVDLLEAHLLSRPSTFRRYGIELGLSELARVRSDREDERRWCWAAVDTVCDDPSTCGASAALTLIELSSGVEHLTPEDRDRCERIARNGWSLFGLPGDPDLSALERTLKQLVERQGQ